MEVLINKFISLSVADTTVDTTVDTTTIVFDKKLINWVLIGDGFIKYNKNHKKYNKKEKDWGHEISNCNNVSWSKVLSEKIVFQLLYLDGQNPRIPINMNGFLPDIETDEFIYEVKTRTYTTSGTAGEKILGTPYKYANIPRLYNKPLKIILVAYQELEAINKFKLFNYNDNSIEKIKILNLWKEIGIEYIKCSDLMKNVFNKIGYLYTN